MNKKKFIYGLVAFTIMSCQSTPNTINQEVKKDKKIQNGSLVKNLDNDNLKFNILSVSEVYDCYNSGRFNITYDSIKVMGFPEGNRDFVCGDYGLVYGWDGCYDLINVKCTNNNGDDGSGESGNNCNESNNSFSTKALNQDQKLELSYFNNLYRITMNTIYQTKFNKIDDFTRGSQYETADNTLATPNSPDPYHVINELTPLYVKKKNNYDTKSLPQYITSIDESINKNKILSNDLINYSTQLKVFINEVSSVYLTFRKGQLAEDKYNQMIDQQELFRQSIVNTIRSYNKSMGAKQKLEVISSQVSKIGQVVNALNRKDSYGNTNLDYAIRIRQRFDERYDNHLRGGSSPYSDKILMKELNSFEHFIVSQKVIVDYSKSQLEKEGFISPTGQVLETDPDVKRILDDLLKVSSDLNSNLDSISTVTKDTDLTSFENQVENKSDSIKSEYDTVKSKVELEIGEQIEEDLECADLKLKVDKKEFSPNNDNVDDTATFTITAPKGKSWNLDISKIKDKDNNTQDEYEKAVDEYLGLSPEPEIEEKKSFSGTGTGEKVDTIWDGKDSNNKVISDGKYELILKSNGKEIKKNITKSGGAKFLFNADMTVETAKEEGSLSTQGFSAKAVVPIKDGDVFEVGKGDQALLSMTTYWDQKYIIGNGESVKISGLFLLVGPDKNGDIKTVARYPKEEPLTLSVNQANQRIESQNSFKINSFWFGRDEIKEKRERVNPYFVKGGRYEVKFKTFTVETNIKGFEKVDASMLRFVVNNKFKNYSDKAPYKVVGDFQQSDLKQNIKYHIREAHDINFMNAKAFVNINAYLHDQSKYSTFLNNIVRLNEKENNAEKKGVCFNKLWTPEKIFSNVESVANIKGVYDTWTTDSSPDFIQSYRYRGLDSSGKKNVTNYSTRDGHNIQIIFNKGLDGNLRIATAYPDIDVDLGNAIPLDQVRQYYESLMSNGSASDSVSRNQVYQNALTEFKKALLWANDNNTGALTPLAKSMLLDHDDKAGYLKILKADQNPKRGRLLPELKNCNTLISVYAKLKDNQGIY